MSYTSAPDINVLITVPSETKTANAKPLVSSERRINPSWTISHLKVKLEPITGIPTSSQTLRTRLLDGTQITLSHDDSFVGDPTYGLRKGSEIEVLDGRPPSLRQNFNDLSAVEKYEMPVEQYERLDDSVLAWKRKQKLGRFDPSAKSGVELERERRDGDEMLVRTKGVELGKRCRVGADDTRRGTIRYVGEIQGLGGEKEAGCFWVGVELDEPLGRNDGSVSLEVDGQPRKRRMFECADKFGVFARPEKIEVGEYPPLDDFDEDMEEL